jgi:hypothetical protein
MFRYKAVFGNHANIAAATPACDWRHRRETADDQTWLIAATPTSLLTSF